MNSNNVETNETGIKLTRADAVRVGDQVAEQDGYLLTVENIARMPRGEVVLYLRDPMGYRTGQLMHKPVRPATLVRVAS